MTLTAIALATSVCLPTPEMHKFLTDEYGEKPVAAALSNQGVILELWIAPNTGTWSALHTTASGRSCLVDTGKESVVIPPAPEGDPA